jgi:glycyl-tRNA synthetase
VVRETLPRPVRAIEWLADLNMKLVGPQFKRDARIIQIAVESLDQASLEALATEFCEHGVATIHTPRLSDGSTSVSLPPNLLFIAQTARLHSTREYTPNVIKPSFGIGRILYCLLEHVFWHRPNDPARTILSLPAHLAPTKVLILPLTSSSLFTPVTHRLSAQLRKLGIANSVDAASSASIGKRYARNDELGTPFAVTVDFETLADGSVTLRERDSMVQVRGAEGEVVEVVRGLVGGVVDWAEVLSGGRLRVVVKDEGARARSDGSRTGGL